jgi:hypothetical protein
VEFHAYAMIDRQAGRKRAKRTAAWQEICITRRRQHVDAIARRPDVRRGPDMGLGFVIALWIVLAFVYFAVSATSSTAPRRSWRQSLRSGGVFSTASIAAMISHYGHDKNSSELDIRHLDANR